MQRSIICIGGSSGGTGKSTLAKELAIIFSKRQLRTCLIDLSGCTQNALFRILPRVGIADWLKDYRSVAVNLPLDKLTARYSWDHIQQYLTFSHSHNIYLLTSPADQNTVDISTPELETFLSFLREYFDVILLDTSNSIDSPTTAAFACSDHTLLVATADTTCVFSLKKLRHFIRSQDWGLKRFSLILNRQPRSRQAYTPNDLESILYLPVIAVLPEDADAWMYNNAGLAISLGENSALKKALCQLADTLENI